MFDIAFAQLGVIPKTRNKLVEIVAVAKRYHIIAHEKIKESKKQPFGIRLPVTLTVGGMSIKKRKTCLYLK